MPKVKIPVENADDIIQALGDMGAGMIGDYTHYSISADCIGRFKGNNDSTPYIGTKNQLEKVKKIKIEFQCEIEKVKVVLQRLKEIHPYEEPAIDLIPLIDENDL